MRHLLAGAALLALLSPTPVQAQAHDAAGRNLGTVRFAVSCAPAVRGDFDRAVALLHHMMYVEARAAFGEIAAKDPKCAMAPWGVAMTLFQPLWPSRPGPEQLQRGWEAVQQAEALGPKTPRERALVAAAEAFFREPATADWWTRIRRWSAAMDEAHRAAPHDTETSAFYALSQLAVAPLSEDRMAYQARAAGVLQEITRKTPTHPGAVHYTIHANDVEGRAGLSLDVVRSYDHIAPSVPHALHMPTHIYVRLGDWPDVIEWNRKSADAALRFPVDGKVSIHYVHAMDYLLEALLQRGDDAKAKAVVDEALSHGPNQEDFASAFHLAAMPARYAVERRAWAEAAAITPRMPAALAWDRYPWPEAISWFAKGLGAARTGDLAGAKAAEARMRALSDQAGAANERDFQRYIETDRLVLAGWIAQAEGDAAGAVARMREAVQVEASVQKHPITPGALYPPNEALGDLLAEQQRPAEALAAYRHGLEIWPKRYHSLLGAARAARAAGEPESAKALYSELVEVADGGSTRAGVQEAKAVKTAGG